MKRNCEILDGISVLSADAGVMTSTLNSTKFITSGSGRKNVTHIVPNIGTNASIAWAYQWQFSWVAPNTDSAVVYICGTYGPKDSIPTNDAVTTYSVVFTKATSTAINKGTDNSLSLNLYPNPTSDNFKLSYILQNNSNVKIELIAIKGACVATVSDENQIKGIHFVNYDLANIEKGIYFVKISLDKKQESKRILIVQ